MNIASLAQRLGCLALLMLAACSRPAATSFQGYLEGEFVHVAAPLAGRLEHLAVTRGARIEADAPLFTLEHAAETAAAAQAEARLLQARARFEDLLKGSRASELDALRARLAQARAAAELSGIEAARQAALFKKGVSPGSENDRARLTHERDLRAIDDLAAQLATAGLGGRTDALAAAGQEVAAAAAARDQAAWAVAQKTQAAPRAALVHDTLYREGEFVAAGRPVVSLLPPENIKVRFFAPEPALAALRPGVRVRVGLDGRAPVEAVVAYVSPQAEYTPPVLYNRENRAKLVYLVEAALRPEDARALHPGQPVDVTPLP
jgi:HlyD family secretion protein